MEFLEPCSVSGGLAAKQLKPLTSDLLGPGSSLRLARHYFLRHETILHFVSLNPSVLGPVFMEVGDPRYSCRRGNGWGDLLCKHDQIN